MQEKTTPLRRRRAPGLWLLALAAACSSREAQGPPPVSVGVIEVAAQPAAPTEVYVARIEASNTVEVRPQVDGLLKQQAAVEGQRVSRGDVLFLIDPGPNQAALARARADLAQARSREIQSRRDRARIQELAKSNVASQQALDAAVSDEEAASAAVKAAEARVETARLKLDYTRIVSPIDGVVGRAQVRVGAAVTAYETLLTTVYANDPMYVDFSISEQRMLAMQRELGPDIARAAGSFHLLLADGSEYPHPASLDFVDQALDPKNATLPMRLRVPNPEGLLRANQFARVVVPAPAIADALLVPVRAVQEMQGIHSLWVVDAEGHAQPRDVELGARLGNQWIVRSGLSPGDRVVVDGVQKLRPGIPVREEPVAKVAAESAGGPGGS